MLSKFISFMQENKLADVSENILLGVSGGIDSVVMTDLFKKAHMNFAIAHCNFKLRSDESDGDQTFVEQLAIKHKVKYFTIKFDTSGYSKREGISIQMAARDLRYNWFNDLADKHGFDHIAIAHNSDDVAETMLLNLIRGTGLKGLTGIKPIQDRIIRPLLCVGRTEIEEYAIKEKIAYREDSSNKESKYYRNLIRNEIIPLMRKINPSLHETLNLEAEIFTSTFALYKKELDNIRDAVTLENDQKWVLSIPKMLSLRLSPPILYDLLMPYGYTFTDAQNILISLQAVPGKTFYSEHYILLKDRNTVIIEKNDIMKQNREYEIPDGCKELYSPIRLSLKKAPRDSDFQIPTSPNSIALDADKVIFPLKLRLWAKGDYFFPLGMGGRKKLSDFFIDRKINVLEKERMWLLLSQDDIIWIVGQQIDNRYRICLETKNILLITLKN